MGYIGIHMALPLPRKGKESFLRHLSYTWLRPMPCPFGLQEVRAWQGENSLLQRALEESHLGAEEEEDKVKKTQVRSIINCSFICYLQKKYLILRVQIWTSVPCSSVPYALPIGQAFFDRSKLGSTENGIADLSPSHLQLAGFCSCAQGVTGTRFCFLLCHATCLEFRHGNITSLYFSIIYQRTSWWLHVWAL